MRLFVAEIAVFLVFFGLHTGIAIAPGGTLLLPFVLSFMGAAAIAIAYPERLSTRLIRIFVFLGAILLGMAFITSREDSAFNQHFISSGLFLYSLAIAYCTFIGLSVMGLRRTSKFFLLAAFVLIIGCFLELHGGLKPLSDAFRQAANSWRSNEIYSGDTRDVMNYGGLRPNFFASEPSIVGIMTGFAILFWFVSTGKFTAFRLGKMLALSAIAFAIIRSPTTVVCSAVCVILIVSEVGVAGNVPRWRTIWLCAAALFAILFVPEIVASNTNYGQTGSFFERELGPPLIAAEVVRNQPLLGTGFGGSTKLIEYTIGVYSSVGGPQQANLVKSALSDQSVAKKLLSSQFWELWVDLGLLGGAVFVYMLWRVLGYLSVPNRMMVLCSAALMLTMSGGVVSPQGWVGVFSLAALYERHWAARNAALVSML